MELIHTPQDIPALAAALQRFSGIDPNHAHLNEEEAAACLELQPKTLESWRREGRELPFLKIGRSVKYRLSDILACIDRNTFVSSRDAKTRDRRAPVLRRSRRLSTTNPEAKI